MYINVPDFPAADPLTALAVGIVSGLAATGADQVIKQIGKDQLTLARASFCGVPAFFVVS